MKKMSCITFFILILFLMPGPSFWYQFFNELNTPVNSRLNTLIEKIQVFLIAIEEDSDHKQLFTHFSLMMIWTFFGINELFKLDLIKKLNYFSVAILSSFLVFIFSALVELIQFSLPKSFARGFAWIDIIFSIMGGFLGCFICMIYKKRLRS